MWWYFVVLLPLAVIIWLFYEWYEHEAVLYSTTKVEYRQLPKQSDLRLCLISDLHNNRKNLSRLSANIRNFAPDVILLAGDLVDKHKKENPQAKAFLEAISKLEIPVFYSEGNHELSLSEQHPKEWELYIKELPKNVRFLKNEAVCLKHTVPVYISGLSLPKEYYKKGNLYEETFLLPELIVPKEGFHIMMAHNPEYARQYEKYHADFIVSGHLHGGLLRLPFLGGLVSPRLRLPEGCDAGLAELSDESVLFVSRGLGSHTIPLRFFNRVEVNFLVLKGMGNEIPKKEME